MSEKIKSEYPPSVQGSSYFVPMVVFILLFLGALAFGLWSAIKGPPFGEVKEKLTNYEGIKIDLAELLSFNDSIMEINDALMEQSDRSEGVFYEVQIGAFENFDLKKYSENLSRLRSDKDGELNKYTLGKFRKLATARSFHKDIVKLGINDSFIVPYFNGKRVSMKEASKKSRRR